MNKSENGTPAMLETDYSPTVTEYYLNGMNRQTKHSGHYGFVSSSYQKDGLELNI
jgi:hypothetical protein